MSADVQNASPTTDPGNGGSQSHLTISDIFAALIEHRHYKPAMPPETVYDMLCGMNGKLEQTLVVSFKDAALTR